MLVVLPAGSGNSLLYKMAAVDITHGNQKTLVIVPYRTLIKLAQKSCDSLHIPHTIFKRGTELADAPILLWIIEQLSLMNKLGTAAGVPVA